MIFKNSDFEMHYEVAPGVLPQDTLFIHGNLASNQWWQPALKIWQNQNGTRAGSAILAEWRGCGDSSAPHSEAELHPEVLAKDYVALLQHLGKTRVALVGHSTGGLIGLMAMLQAPEMFSAAFLLDTVSATGIQFEPTMYDAFTQMSQNRAMCELVIGGTIYKNDPTVPIFNTLVDDAFRVGRHVWHGVPRHLHSIDIRHDLAKITHPVTVAHGEYDNVLPINRSQDLARDLPNGKFIKIPNQGHSTNVENPQKFVDMVNQYLFEKS